MSRPAKVFDAEDLDHAEALLADGGDLRAAGLEVSIRRLRRVYRNGSASERRDAVISYESLRKALAARQETMSSKNPEYTPAHACQETPVQLEVRSSEPQTQVQGGAQTREATPKAEIAAEHVKGGNPPRIEPGASEVE